MRSRKLKYRTRKTLKRQTNGSSRKRSFLKRGGSRTLRKKRINSRTRTLRKTISLKRRVSKKNKKGGVDYPDVQRPDLSDLDFYWAEEFSNVYNDYIDQYCCTETDV